MRRETPEYGLRESTGEFDTYLRHKLVRPRGACYKLFFGEESEDIGVAQRTFWVIDLPLGKGKIEIACFSNN